MSDKPVNTINMLERVAKLEERVDGGFGFVNKESLANMENNLIERLALALALAEHVAIGFFF